MIPKQNIYSTASLLNISISEQEADILQNSLTQIIEYFAIMEKALTSVQNIDTSITDDITATAQTLVQYRNDEAQPYPDPKSLIEKSEEHEENFIVIPNIL